jgi:hypothetical protein
MLLALVGCSGAVPPDVARTTAKSVVLPADLPPPRTFGAPRPTQPQRSNQALAADFLELEFQLESGRQLPIFTRFAEPITLRLSGNVPPSAEGDIARLTSRLQAEAGITIVRTEAEAALTVTFLPRSLIRDRDPKVACFVVPGVSSWNGYQAARGDEALDWVKLTRRDRMAIFVPSDASPQETRDCLHEELAQAIGPLNDLYRLSDSVFNDDNFHTVLTGFDMLMLRIHYAPELANGMTKAEVAARLPGILARLNPKGRHSGTPLAGPTPTAWTAAMETALGTRASASSRQRAARTAVRIAEAEGWTDGRLAFSHFANGRVSLGIDGQAAIVELNKASAIYGTLPDGQIHAAHVNMQLAALALSRGQSDQALILTDQAIPVVEAAENAALLATLLLIRSEALLLQGRAAEALAARQEGLGWARYGFGSGSDLAQRVAAIAALVPDGFRG